MQEKVGSPLQMRFSVMECMITIRRGGFITGLLSLHSISTGAKYRFIPLPGTSHFGIAASRNTLKNKGKCVGYVMDRTWHFSTHKFILKEKKQQNRDYQGSLSISRVLLMSKYISILWPFLFCFRYTERRHAWQCLPALNKYTPISNTFTSNMYKSQD